MGPLQLEPECATQVRADKVKLWYTNACSLRGKWGELEARIKGSEIVAITETWMKEENHTFLVSDYHAYRQDRTDGRQGGGVLILVKSDYSQRDPQISLVTPNIQSIACSIQQGRQSVGVVCLYRAPQT